jgi:predicted enzyme related to lactoylglutathione lyase
MNMQLLANIDVDDLDAAIEFYASALGLRMGRRFSDHGAEMLGASSPIYLLVRPAGSPASASTSQRRTYERHWTPVHLDFVVEHIHAAVQKAQSAGAQLEKEVQTRKWGYLARMADPFGNGFCLIQFLGRGYDEIAQHSPGSRHAR